MVRPSFSSPAVFWLAATVVCILFGGPLLQPALAQTPTPEQIQIFQNLPPDQQQAILETLEKDGASGTTKAPRADRRVTFPDTVRPRQGRATPTG